MIIGTGIDITEIKRIEALLEKGGFIERIFTEKEAEYFKERKLAPESVAGTFAAKEAVSKALGTGIRGFNLKDVEILHNSLGAPSVKLHNGALKKAEELKIGKMHLSISHSEKYAVASVVLEEELK